MTCGIYMLTLGTKRYVGQAVNIEIRWRAHSCVGRKQSTTNLLWKNCFNKHGITKHEILQECTREELNSLERHYIATLKPELNVMPGGGGWGSLGHMPSAETRAKMSKAKLGKKFGPLSAEHRVKLSKAHRGKKRRPHSAEHRASIGKAHLGKTRSAEVCASISKAKLGQKYRPCSAEARANISKAALGKTKSAEHIANVVAAKKLNRCLRLINSRPHAA
jgi:group I intron endonuclease